MSTTMVVGASLLVCALVAGANAQSNDLPDCECKRNWVHNEYKCNSTNPGGVQGATFNGCPKLSELGKCEYAPEQSWCETKKKNCKQQTTESKGEGWVYCDPENNGVPQKPFCTCKSSWKHTEGRCAHSKGGSRMKGCPTIEQLRECEPDITDYAQSWCETEEEDCFEQENWVDSVDALNETIQVGEGWAYCSPTTGEAELPNCDCGSPSGEAEWSPDSNDCPDVDYTQTEAKSLPIPVFTGCVTTQKIADACGPDVWEMPGVDLPWCNTIQKRCKQQSSSSEFPNMIGDGWAYCDLESDVGVLPTCECKADWVHKEGKCSDKELNLKMSGCPALGQIGLCEFHATESWCDTTYDYCDVQPDDEVGEGWAYCSPKSQATILPPCECKERWIHDKGVPEEGDVCDLSNPKQFRGCPTVDQIDECELAATESWCYTTSSACRDQDEESADDGWVYCDPYTQLAVHHEHKIGGAIGATFVLTVLFCSTIFIGFLLGYRRYLNRHKRGYSQELLEPESDYEAGK